MSEERFEQEEPKDETEDVEDVEAHKRVAASDTPGSEDENDEVEAHRRKA